MQHVSRMKNRRGIVAFILCAVTASLVLSLPYPQEVAARDSRLTAENISGTYLAFEDETFQLLLTFNQDGTFLALNSGATEGGFTTQQGSWQLTKNGKLKGRTIAYLFDPESGETFGVVSQVYTLTLANLEHRKYQTLKGKIDGEAFDASQNPLAPTAPPFFTFIAKVSDGKRVTTK